MQQIPSILPQSYPLLIKPASSCCNLRCHHCFYTGKKIGKISSGLMSLATLESMIREYAQLPLDQYSFIWQGGEPALMGQSFYEEAIILQKKYISSSIPIENYFQTNGTLLDRNFVQFLARNDFLVGISIDGPQEFHNFHRVFPDGQGSFTKVMEVYSLLKEYNVKTNVLTLISAHNVAHIGQIYDWLTEIGFVYQQYIPCVEISNNAPESWTVFPEAWGDALCILFDKWIASACTVNIRYFEALLQQLIVNIPGMCQFGKSCLQYAVVESNGSVYPCDFFVKKEMELGNICSISWQQIITSKKYNDFGLRKMDISTQCKNCSFLSVCYGDCQKHRVKFDNIQEKSWLCEGYQKFFKHALPIFNQLASYHKA